jgi:hypothetical protein
MYRKKKSQVWYIDFMVGLLILITTLIIFYQYQGNLSDRAEAEWQEMIIDSKSISSTLMTEGYPLNWTNETVEILGLTDGNYRINGTKVMQFKNMSYKHARQVFRTRFQFYFFIEDSNGTKMYDAGLNATDPSFLVQATRFVLYNSTISRMVLHLWQT